MLQKMNRNQKGFSLVEVLIAMSILSVVCFMAFRFMSSSSKLFSKTNAEVNIQTEAQNAANTIKDLIMDCQVSVAYFDTKMDPTNVFEDNGVIYSDVLLVSNNNEQFLIYPNPSKADELLYLSRKRNDSTGKFDISFNPADAEVLAQFVEEFKVDTSRFDATKMVDFSLVYSSRGKEYEGNYQVRMRNDITVSKVVDYEVVDVDKVTDVYVIPQMVVITPDISSSTDIIAPTDFSTQVRTQGLADASVVWSLSKTLPEVSLDQNGLLVFNAEPTVDSFFVNATSVANPEEEGRATIKIKKLTNLSVMAVSGITGVVEGVESANQNSRVMYAGIVEGWNLTSTDQSVTWKVEYKPRYDIPGDYTLLSYFDPTTKTYVDLKPEIATMNAGGVLAMGKNATNNFEFKITATANFPNYGKPITYESVSTLLRVKNVDVDFDGYFIRDYDINLRNYFLSGKAAVDGHINADVTEIRSFDKAMYSNGVTMKNLVVDTSKFANGVLNVDISSVNYSSAEDNRKYYDELQIETHVRDQNDVVQKMIVTLPKVTMSKGAPDSSYIVISKGSTLNIPFTYSGINVTSADQIGIYIDGEKVSGSGSSGVNQYLASYLQTTNADGSSALGSDDKYVDTQTVRLSATTTGTHYPTQKSNLTIALDDFYQVSGKAAESHITYDVYVANVEGQNMYIPVPGAEGFPTSINTSQKYKFAPDESKEVTLSTSGNKYYMKYSAKTYVYDDVHSCWKIK